ncbi:MAG: hypothetical protein M5U19_01510 [Microthrixaceae bacterium]|nr:hypothetical protein [Microthrixaceae bacterium]
MADSPQFLDRARRELDRLAEQAREGSRDAEDLIGEMLGNVQQLIEDFQSWVSEETDRIAKMAEDQRKRRGTASVGRRQLQGHR